MKLLICTLFITLSSIYGNAQTNTASTKAEVLDSTSLTDNDIEKLVVTKSDSSLFLFGDIRKDYRTFGYEKPDVNSKKMILFSVFTDYVENNPFKCPLGSYYQTASMKIILKYVSIQGAFVKTIAIKDNVKIATVYFLKKCIEFGR